MLVERHQIYFDLKEMTKEEAIRFAGNKLVELGYVEFAYVDSMIEKEKSDITYIGNGIAIPHGKYEAISLVKKSGIVVLHFRNGISYDEETAYIIIGIAANADDHIGVLSDIAITLSDEHTVQELIHSSDVEDFMAILNT